MFDQNSMSVQNNPIKPALRLVFLGVFFGGFYWAGFLLPTLSDYHVGGVLQQQVGKTWQLLAFFSKKLTATQQRYSTFDRKLPSWPFATSDSGWRAEISSCTQIISHL
jgi:RNase H-like domain found in reverse transcriptase